MGLLNIPRELLTGLLNQFDGDPNTTFRSAFSSGGSGFGAQPISGDGGLYSQQMRGGGGSVAPVAPVETRALPNPDGSPGQLPYGDTYMPPMAQGLGASQAAPHRGIDWRKFAGRLGDGLQIMGAGLEGGSAEVRQVRAHQAEQEMAPQLAAIIGQDPSKALPILMKYQAMGVNVAPYMAELQYARQQGQRNSYLEGVPQADRAIAEMDVPGYVKWDRDSKIPMILNPGNGAVVAIDKRKGVPTEIYRAPKQPTPGWETGPDGRMVPTPGGPYDPKYLSQRRDATHVDPRERARTPSIVLGEIADKLARGQTLSPGEQKVWDDSHRAANGGFLGGLGLDYGDEGDTRPAPNTSLTGNAPPLKPGAKPPPLKGAPPAPAAAAGSPPMSALQPGVNTTFKNGQTWTIKGGKAVRVK